jgi:Leucine-rich repeat (LRR) protein
VLLFVSDLNLAHNRLSGLPPQMTEMVQLESVDISHNAFLQLPECLFAMARLNTINAKKNFIAGTKHSCAL